MKKIKLTDLRGKLQLCVQNVFERIMNVPQEIRKDDKRRTGITVLLKEDETKDNLILLTVGEPSEAAQYYGIEKAVRSYMLNNASSENSEDKELFFYPGSIAVTMNGVTYRASTSGLQPHEDVAIDVALLAEALQLTTIQVMMNVRNNGGLLPECFEEEGHYLQPIIDLVPVQ